MELKRKHTHGRRARGRTLGAAVLAALGLASLSPVQQGAVLTAAGAAALWASPVLARSQIPGVGIVIKSDCAYVPKPCKRHAIVAPSDGKGEVRLTGLGPGTYTVQVIGGAQELPMKVGPDGTLAFVAYEDAKGVAPPPKPRAGGRRPPPPLPVVKRWAEQIGFSHNSAVPPPPAVGSPAEYCPNGPSCGWNVLDLNTNSADKIARATGTSMQSAVQIVVLREKGGPYTSIEDFARRNCPTNAIEMNQGTVKIADATVILGPSTGKPIAPGFQCQPNDAGQFSLYGKKHNYVGHVTLLR